METLAKRMSYARQRRGWNQAQLAKESGVSPQLINQLEGGQNEGSAKLPAIAIALKVNCEWLYAGTGPMESDISGAKLEPNIFTRSVVAVLDAIAAENVQLDSKEIAEICLDTYIEAVSIQGTVNERSEGIVAGTLIRSTVRKKH